MAKISTEPTQLGAGVLDPFHPYGIAKRLRNKPIDHFAGTDTWLRVAAAEQDKLITLSWELGGMLVGTCCREGGVVHHLPAAAAGSSCMHQWRLVQAIMKQWPLCLASRCPLFAVYFGIHELSVMAPNVASLVTP
jgi:hypothetical protein